MDYKAAISEAVNHLQPEDHGCVLIRLRQVCWETAHQ